MSHLFIPVGKYDEHDTRIEALQEDAIIESNNTFDKDRNVKKYLNSMLNNAKYYIASQAVSIEEIDEIDDFDEFVDSIDDTQKLKILENAITVSHKLFLYIYNKINYTGSHSGLYKYAVMINTENKRKRKHETIMFLLEKNIVPDANSLIEACNIHYDILKKFLELGADPNMTELYIPEKNIGHYSYSLNVTPLFMLVADYKSDPDDTLKAINLLIEYGADVNFESNGINVFMQAAVNPDVRIAKLLVEKGANIYSSLGQNYNAIHRLCMESSSNGLNKSDYTEIFNYLISLGMEVDNVIAEGKGYTSLYTWFTPLAIICINYSYNRANFNTDIVELLIKHGANVNFKRYGGTILQYLSQNMNIKDKARDDLIEILKKHGAV